MSKKVLQLSGIYKSYNTSAGRLPVLKDVNLTIYAGETVAIVGQSGSGKSTLLHVAGLLDKPNKGEVFVQEAKTVLLKDSVKSLIRNKTYGFVYQQHHLLREFTALENVLMPASIAGEMTLENKEYAHHLLETVGLQNRIEHLPGQLSGGEQQRVAIARALMNKPRLLLADEPTGNLDPQTAAEVSQLFDKLVKEQNMAVLLVTHNASLAKACKTRYHMADGHLQKGK